MPDLLECECGKVFPENDWRCPACKSEEVEAVTDHGRLRYAHEILDDALTLARTIYAGRLWNIVSLTKTIPRLELLGGVIDDAIGVYDAAVLAGQRENGHG